DDHKKEETILSTGREKREFYEKEEEEAILSTGKDNFINRKRQFYQQEEAILSTGRDNCINRKGQFYRTLREVDLPDSRRNSTTRKLKSLPTPSQVTKRHMQNFHDDFTYKI
ncbi:hypothetical protein L9F63_018779, partial [Diploptera punctata]